MQSIVKPDVQKEIFSVHSSIVKETESETKYQIPCDTSNGFMHCYHLFPGIDLAYSTFEAFSCSMRDHYIPNVLGNCILQKPAALNVSISMVI